MPAFLSPVSPSVVLLDVYPVEGAKSSIRVFSEPELSPQCLEGTFLQPEGVLNSLRQLLPQSLREQCREETKRKNSLCLFVVLIKH